MVTTRAIDLSRLLLLLAALTVMAIGTGVATQAAARTAPRADVERMIVEEGRRGGLFADADGRLNGS